MVKRLAASSLELAMCALTVGFAPVAFAGEPAPAPAPTLDAEPMSEETVQGLLFGSPELSAEFHGFVALEYFDFRGDPERPNPSFDLHNFFLSAKSHIGSSVTLFGEVEYEHGSEVRLDRAFVEWELAEALTVRVGRFSVPLSYERIHYRAPARLTTSRPLGVDIAFHEWSDNGLEAYGRWGRLGYDVAVVNGPSGLTEAGIPNFDEIDVNRNKTLIARVNLNPVHWIETGIAGAIGTYDPEGRSAFRLLEADARLRHGAVDVWVEADYRNAHSEPCSPTEDATCPASYAGDHGNKLGYYVLASYAVVRGVPNVHYLRPLVRFDELDDLVDGSVQRRATVGLDWSPRPHLVLKTEYQVRFGPAGAGITSEGFMASVVGDF